MGSGSSSPTKGKIGRQLSGEEALRQLKHENRDSDTVRFISFSKFKERGSFPRYPENFDVTEDLATMDLSNCLVIFVSHQWLRSSDDDDDENGEILDDEIHPDNEFHEKFMMCVAGIQKILDNCAPRYQKQGRCFLWLDYGCINQNGNPASRLKSLTEVMQCCDCVFTPLVDQEQDEWELEITEAGLYEDYLAKSFSDYLERAWCRLELWYMTDIPLSKHSLGKLKYLKGSLRNAIFSKRRPHYVFGSKEYREEESPICFPPLTDAFFMESLPTEGVMSQPRDLKRIDQLVKDLKPFLKPIKLGYVGNKNAMGQLHGKGSFHFSSGNWYEGSYKNNKRDGYGKFVFSNGNMYVGEWKEDRRHGYGTYCFVSGEMYVGQWEMNKKHGKGKLEYASGNIYEGMYKNDKRHGRGKLLFADGKTSYDGMYYEDKMDGYGVFRFADGDVYEGQWKDDMKHGQGKYTSSKNEVYNGEWRNNLQHGHGTFAFFNGDKYDGEWYEGKRHGFGKFYFQDGTMLKRMWEDGKMLEE